MTSNLNCQRIGIAAASLAFVAMLAAPGAAAAAVVADRTACVAGNATFTGVNPGPQLDTDCVVAAGVCSLVVAVVNIPPVTTPPTPPTHAPIVSPAYTVNGVFRLNVIHDPADTTTIDPTSTC
jgi:hypothetical protein